jgi:DNA helicase HerA-like ATPase
MREGEDGSVVAAIDFLGEGTREANGGMSGFPSRRHPLPDPGRRVHAVSTEDLRQVFAASDSAHIEIGTVYPTDDIRGALYIDPMLSKHFAILGSTGTGKSTSVA